jgi:hypothetical protein
MAVEQLGGRADDGTTVAGATTDLVSLYGVTPVAQASAITGPATTGSAVSGYGFTTASQADAVVTSVNSIILALKNIGVTA